MNLFKQQQNTSGYNTIPNDNAADDTAVPLGTTIQSQSMTTTTGTWPNGGEDDTFRTCYQYGNLEQYCWTNAYYTSDFFFKGYAGFYQCVPDGGGKAWHTLDPKYVNPVTTPNSCGDPCQEVHEDHPWNPL